MIPKNGDRFSEKIMRRQKARFYGPVIRRPPGSGTAGDQTFDLFNADLRRIEPLKVSTVSCGGERQAGRRPSCMPVTPSGYILGVGRHRMRRSPRCERGCKFVLAMRRHLRLALMLAVVLAAAAPAAVRAQGKLEARYSASLAGIPIGKGSWVIDITDTQYMAAASGVTTGLMRAFSGGQGTSAAHGTLHAGQPTVSTFASTIAASNKTDDVNLTVANGIVTETRLDPPLETEPD